MTDIHFTIKPYVGAGPLRFGMTAPEVESAIGPPMQRSTNFRGETTYDYDSFNVGFTNDGIVCHIGFVLGSDVEFDGKPLFSRESFEQLLTVDGNPQEVVGFVVLLKLGIAFTGFHDKDESQKAVTVFSKGTYDALQKKMTGSVEKYSAPEDHDVVGEDHESEVAGL